MAVIPRLAAAAPVPVLLLAGHGSSHTRQALRADGRVRLVRSPRHASVLLVTGRIATSDGAALLQVHDQVPHPRAVVALAATGLPAELEVTHEVVAEDLVDRLVSIGREVIAGQVDTADVLPAENPVEWQGVGPHGTGGKGMMGGVPYGRPMAMTDDGRDGLALDRLSLVLGPWLPGLPVGCRLDVGLQGDVLEEATVRFSGLADPPPGSVPVALLERLRARVLLGWTADLVDLAGLPAEASRVSRLALAPDLRALARARRRLERPWGLHLATDGLAPLEVADLEGRGLGWLARSRGIAEDLRVDDPAYASVEVATPTDRGPDATGRWRTWLDEAEHALHIAEAVGEDVVTDTPELPWGPVDVDEAERTVTREALAREVATGSEIGRALLGIATLRGAADAEAVLLAGVPA